MSWSKRAKLFLELAVTFTINSFNSERRGTDLLGKEIRKGEETRLTFFCGRE